MTLYPAGFSQIEVVDIADFWESGNLTITDSAGSSETVGYVVPEDPTPADDGSGVLDLDTSLIGTYDQGDTVLLSPTAVERWADVVEPNGQEYLRVLVPHNLLALLAVGVREPGAGELVKFEQDGTDYVITDILGKDVRGFDLVASDSTTVPASGELIRWSKRSNGAQAAYIGAWQPLAGAALLRLYSQAEDSNNATTSVAASDGAVTAAIAAMVDAGTRSISISLGGLSGTYLLIDSTGDSDFLLADGSNFAWQNWTPTLTGWSANPTNAVYRYTQIGKLVTVTIAQGTNGTSDSATKTISLPVTAATITNQTWRTACEAVDNGAALTTSSLASIASGGSNIVFGKDMSGTGGWTAANGHRIVACQITYEAV